MKLLTILIATVFIAAVIAPLPGNACGCKASASASVGANSATASSTISAYGIELGGYYLTCTGNRPLGLKFIGSTSDSLNISLNHRAKVSASGSVGGKCRVNGCQDYDAATAGP